MFSIKKIKGDFRFMRFRFPIEAHKALREAGVIAVEHFTKGFEKGGGQTNVSRGGWQPRKKIDSGRAILVKSGALKNSIYVIGYGFNKITIGTRGVKYAARHNSGLKGMPRRNFIGNSVGLNKKVKTMLKKRLFSKL